VGAAIERGQEARLNSLVLNPAPAKVPARLASGVVGRNREFLPAALEVLETPAAPLPVALMLTICAFFALAFAWSFIGRLDVNAVAAGKIEAAGRIKIIQPVDPGKISAIRAENGAHVNAGDLLLELDPTEAMADERAARGALAAGLAETDRRRFVVDAARAVQSVAADSGSAAAALEAIAVEPHGKIAWEEKTPGNLRQREESVLAADLMQIAGALRALDKQIAQKQATSQRLRMSIAYQNALIDTLDQRVATRQEAIDRKVGTKINLYDAKEELQKSQSALASDEGQLIETDAAMGELQSEKIKALSQFVADNENKLADAARKADEAREALAKASARLSHAKLYAPIDGVVQQLSVTTLGQVVGAGQKLAVVTPTDRSLQVEALVANMDIGFVKIGQDVAVKLDAFPFTRFGALHGTVIRIASEAVDEQEAKRTLADATAPANPAASSAPGQPESFVFPVIVALDEAAMHVDGATIPLTPGMTASVDIKTDSRRIIDYLLSPLAKTVSEAATER
jgi:hemolysin D